MTEVKWFGDVGMDIFPARRLVAVCGCWCVDVDVYECGCWCVDVDVYECGCCCVYGFLYVWGVLYVWVGM